MTLSSLPPAPFEGPRERFARTSPALVSDVDLVALLLGTGTSAEPVEALASRVLRDHGGVPGLARADAATLSTMRGLGPIKADRLRAAIELGRRAEARLPLPTRIRSSADVAALLAPRLAPLEQEHFIALALDARHRVKNELWIAKGTMTSCPVSVADVFRAVLREAVPAVLFVHNHPSGEAEPSADDLTLTTRLVQAGELLGVRVVDHVVVAREGVVSLAEMGLVAGLGTPRSSRAAESTQGRTVGACATPRCSDAPSGSPRSGAKPGRGRPQVTYRLPSPTPRPPMTTPSPFELLLTAREHDLGHGFRVGRVLPQVARRHLGPFVFLDHMGPNTLAVGEGFDVRPHPHIGLSTLTYMFEGGVMHRDSLGNALEIRPGEANLMTAGRGIVHSERAPDWLRQKGGTMHGLQLWLALPVAHEEDAPAFLHVDAPELPELRRDGVVLRVVAGSFEGTTSPIAFPSATTLWDLELEAGASLTLPPTSEERGVYAVTGRIDLVDIRDASETVEARSLALLAEGASVRVVARERARVAVLGGAPLDAPRTVVWNFVSSRPGRIEEARRAWIAREFPLVPGDDVERIPFPGEEER